MGKQIWKPCTVLYPVPSVIVSCGTMDGEKNLLTIAWTGIIDSDPAMTYISVRPERHSFDMIQKTGDFVINLVNKNLVDACDYCGIVSGREHDKFKETNLTPIKSTLVQSPSIYESPVNIECKIESTVALGTHSMFLAKVVSVTVDDRYIDETGKFNFESSEPICYSHGAYYSLGECIGRFGCSMKKK